ncbi:MAG TPA: hypothetical protein VE986_08660 [Hyphomicrobiales bacterium]|nr:hypothetical protein [Hyphomicrobiales bacterium]
MKGFFAALLISQALFGGHPAFGKDGGCTHTWGKGRYKPFGQVQRELHEKLPNAKILRFSLCVADDTHYFLVTILEAQGRVRTIRVPAR